MAEKFSRSEGGPGSAKLQQLTDLLQSDGLDQKLADRVKELDPLHQMGDVTKWTATNPTCAAIVTVALSELPASEKETVIFNQLGQAKNLEAQVECAKGLLQLVSNATAAVPADWASTPVFQAFDVYGGKGFKLITASRAEADRRVSTGDTFAVCNEISVHDAKDQNFVLVVYGGSGAGKTMLAVGIAAMIKAPAAVYHTPSSEATLRTPRPPAKTSEQVPESANEARNAAAVEHVRKVVNHYIPETHRHPHAADLRPFVLILDEHGQYPYFVAGLIAGQGQVREQIRAELRLAATTPIILIVAGTGVEGASLAPGSRPAEYKLILPMPKVWDSISDHMSNPAAVEYVNNDPGAIAAGVRALVSNARCAALFVKFFTEPRNNRTDIFDPSTAGPGVIPKVLQFVEHLTIAEFCRLNRLKTLKFGPLCRVFLQALAVQHTVETLPDRMRVLKTSLGVVVDRARWTTDGLTPPAEEPRYDVAPAYEAMLLRLLGLGDRPASGEGFEESLADFLQLCVMSATCDGVSEYIPAQVGGAAPQSYLLPPPHGWRMPLDLVHWIRGLKHGTAAASSAPAPGLAAATADDDHDAAAKAANAAVDEFANAAVQTARIAIAAAITAANAAADGAAQVNAAVAADAADIAAMAAKAVRSIAASNDANAGALAVERAKAIDAHHRATVISPSLATVPTAHVATYHWPWAMTAKDVPPMREVLGSLSLEQLQELQKFHAVIASAQNVRGNAVILINGAQAPWADIIAVIAGTLVLIQAKRYTTITLRTVDMLLELHKMGCRAPIVVLAKWLDFNFPPSKAPVHALEDKAVAAVFGDTPYTKLTATLEALAAKLQNDGQTMLAKMRHLPGWGPLAEPAPCGVQVAQGNVVADLSGLKRAYVVAAVGNVQALGPAVSSQLGAEKERPILLLQSPLEVTREHRLRGYYPVPVAYKAPFCVSNGPKLPGFSTIAPVPP